MTETFNPGPDAVEIIEREECFRGFYRLDRFHLRHRQFSGEMGPVLRRELFIRHDAVCCLLYTSPSPRDVEESRMPSSA